MQINTNMGAGGVPGTPPSDRPLATARPATDQAAFATSAALEGQLKSLPDSRPDAVDKARDLLQDPNYPPLVLIQKIGRLLAINLSQPSE